MRSLLLTIAVPILAVACSTPPSTPSTIAPVAAPSPTPVADLAQSRGGSALSVWAAPDAAYLAQYDPKLAATAPQCTVPPFTDVRVVQRDVGFAGYQLSDAQRAAIHPLSTPSGGVSDAVSRVASLDGRCSGFVSAGLLTAH